jgi:hypothetical protein
MNITQRKRHLSGAADMKAKFGRYVLFCLALAAAAVFAPGKALAVCCVAYDYQDAHSNTTQILNSINTEELALIQALKDHAGQMTVNSNGQTTALSNMQDTADARATQRAVQQVQVQSVISATQAPSSCNIITGAIGAQPVDQMIQAWRNGLSDAQRDWDKGAPYNGQATASGQGRHAVAIDQVKTHCNNSYADAADVASGTCPTLGVQPGEDEDLKTILGQGTMSQNDAALASEFFVTNSVLPETLGGMPAGYGQTPKGIDDAAQRNTDVMRSSVATYILSHLRASRMDVSGFTTPTNGGAGGTPSSPTAVGGSGSATVDMHQWAESTAAATLGYAQNGTNFPNGVSQDDYQKLRSYSWFNNPNWISSVSTNQQMAEKETPQILAWMAIQNWKAYELQEQSNAALAMILSILEDEHRARQGHSN